MTLTNKKARTEEIFDVTCPESGDPARRTLRDASCPWLWLAVRRLTNRLAVLRSPLINILT